MVRQISLITDSYPAVAGLDTTLARAVLRAVSAGDLGETFRVYSPGRVLAFGKRDSLVPGFTAAAESARGLGYTPLVRLAGGRAAVFNEGTLAFGWTIPIETPGTGIQERFEALAELMVRAFARLGVASDVGEVPGEYCPGRFSVHADGRKVMGVGQRLAPGAAHVGGVIVVDGADTINEVLDPVYAALGLSFDRGATGALSEVSLTARPSKVLAAIVAELELIGTVTRATLSRRIITEARAMLPEHLVAGTSAEPASL